MTKVSLIIPVYNASNCILRCLESISQQTIRDSIELILVDDCSTDGGLSIAREFLMQSGMQWHCVSQSYNAGPGAARNAGLELSSAEYVAFVDADDTLEPSYCETLYEAASSRDADMVWCRAAAGSTVLQNDYNEDRLWLLRHFVTYLWTCMFRREFLLCQGITFPARRSAEDSCFVLCALMAAGVIAPEVRETLYNYTPADTSLTRRRSRSRARERIASMRELRCWAQEKGFYPLYRWSLEWVVLKKGLLLSIRDLITG